MIVGIAMVCVTKVCDPPRQTINPLIVEPSSRWAMVPPAVQSLTRLATKLVSHHSVDHRATEPASRGAVEQSRRGAGMPSSSRQSSKTLNRQAAKRVQLGERARQ
jgi:hypothetical protein